MQQWLVVEIVEYVVHGTVYSDFLYAVLTNNLKEAVFRADEYNKTHLHELVMFLQTKIPADCWGSVQRVKEWMEVGGTEGKNLVWAQLLPVQGLAR